MVLGVACFFLLIDTPALAKRWLSPEEIRYLELSMFVKQGGTSTGESGFKWRDLKVVLMNWRIYVQAYLLFCQSALSYGNRCSNPIRDIGLIEFPPRYQVHPPDYHQSHGIQLHKCPAHFRPSIHCRRDICHRVCTVVRSLLLANAICLHPHGICRSSLFYYPLPERGAGSKKRSGILCSRLVCHRYLSHSARSCVLECKQHRPSVSTGYGNRASELCRQCRWHTG